jgi:xanthine dehydrogenase accessory factor
VNECSIFEKAASLLDAGENVALVTVSAATGSTPGKIGYKILVWGAAGHTLGTVGGGAIESEMIRLATAKLAEPGSRVCRFDLHDEHQDQHGICGGSIEFLVETFDRTWQPLFAELADAVTAGRAGILVSTIETGRPPAKVFLRLPVATDSAADVPEEIFAAAEQMIAEGQAAARVSVRGADVLLENIAHRPRLIILGAGHLASHICKYAKAVQFEVAVCDDRPAFANRQRFPDADHITVESFESLFDIIQVNADSYIVIVTRGHKWDRIVLEKALTTDARYIGMIGSKRKTRLIMEQLAQKGIPNRLLEKVYSPIGISIGALTPEEIALSIVCELVKVRRLGDAAEVGHMKQSLSHNPPGEPI